jgi:uncharacterized iron-regulated membrane protein
MFAFVLPRDVRERYGPLILIGYGLVALGLSFVFLTKILWAVGGLLIIWGIVSGIARWHRRRRDSLDGLTQR